MFGFPEFCTVQYSTILYGIELIEFIFFNSSVRINHSLFKKINIPINNLAQSQLCP